MKLMIKKNATYWCRRTVIPFSLAVLTSFCLDPGRLSAAPVVSESFFFEPKNHLEISGSFESVSPQDVYGDWKNFSISYERKERPDLTWFVNGGTFSRNTGHARMAELGAYKDWNDSFYTYTALSAGSSSDYLPKSRIDHDFNFKFGPEKEYVWTVGGSQIQYYGDHKDHILSTGLTAYRGKWVTSYRIFHNESDPGSVTAYSHSISVGYGREKDQITTLEYSFGKQAYLANYLVDPEEVNDNSRLVSLSHRKWLGDDYGVFGDISYFTLEEGYNSKGFSLGYFREW